MMMTVPMKRYDVVRHLRRRRVCLAAAVMFAVAGLPAAVPARDQAAAPPPPPDGSAGVDPAAYAWLLQENQSLRRLIDNMASQAMTKDAARSVLEREIAAMEKQVADLTAMLNVMRAAAPAPAETENLRRRLAELEEDRERLARDLARVRDREQRLLEQVQGRTDPDARVRMHHDSDLVRERDRENAWLRSEWERLRTHLDGVRRQRDTALGLVEEAMARLHAERHEAERWRERSAARLAAVERESERELERLRASLRVRGETVARLEQEVERLHNEWDQQAQTAAAAQREHERELERLRAALRLRDAMVVRLKTATQTHSRDRQQLKPTIAAAPPRSRPAAVAAPERENDAAEERLASEQRQLRDRHFNAAVRHSRAGRARDAEREYLAALAVDPGDADVHYNLGMLYEQDLGDRPRALRHYRLYLEQRPHSAYADTVRRWAMTLEMER